MNEACLNIIGEMSFPMEPQPTDVSIRLQEMAGIKAVLFDVYGTLFISGSGDISMAGTQDGESAMRGALEASGCRLLNEKHAYEKHFKLIIAEVREVMMRKGTVHPEVEIREIWKQFIAELEKGRLIELSQMPALNELSVRYECAANPIWPMPGARDVLGGLKDRDLHLGIVSNAQFFTPLLFEHFFGKDVTGLGFDSSLCAWSFEHRKGKPDVSLFEVLLEPLKRLGVAADEVLYVGNDMLNDVWTATQAGMRTALFAGDKRSLRLREASSQCADLEPDAVVTELRQLLV